MNGSRDALRCSAAVLLLGALSKAVSACPDWETLVTVATPAAGVEINRTLSTAQITQMAQQTRPGEATGLLRSQLHIEVQVLEPARAKTCWRPALLVSVSPEPSVMYIAREIVPGSCFDTVVLNHEFQHVFATHRVIETLAPVLRDEIIRALNEGMTKGTNAAAGIAREVSLNHRSRIYRGWEIEHRKIDTALESGWLHGTCEGAPDGSQPVYYIPPPVVTTPVGYDVLQ